MIYYRNLQPGEINRPLFHDFIRHQKVTDCWRRKGTEWVIQSAPFIDDWTEADYAFLVDCLKNTLHTGGFVYGAFQDGRLKGFTSVESGLFGGKERYLDLSSIHVSEDLRQHGVGKNLFLAAKDWARRQGARKLYISAHSAVESQAFYRAMGCVEAAVYNQAHVAREPFDCQLECPLFHISRVNCDKKRYLDLLLLADEQADMIDRYLDTGTMYILEDGGVKAECVVTDAGGSTLEIKNIAVLPDCQHQGYGRALIAFLAETYANRYTILEAGTGDSPLTVPFYEACGFQRGRVVRNFFTDNYDHPIYEAGRQLIDMVYFEKKL